MVRGGRAALICIAAALAATMAVAGTLEDARNEVVAAERRAAQLETLAAQARGDAARLEAQSALIVARIRTAEARIDEAERRWAEASRRRAAIRRQLAAEQEPLLRLGAAMQMLARRPAALAFVQPGDNADYLRVSAAMDAVRPVIDQRTASLRQSLDRAEALERRMREAAERRRAEHRELGAKVDALAALERNALARSADLANAAATQKTRSLAFAEEARDAETEARRRRFAEVIEASLRDLPSPPVPASRPGAQGPLAIRPPVRGQVVTGMGELSSAGIHARGVAIRPAPSSLVGAPAGGRVLFAARFRSYGEIVIIDHGNGWTSTLTGLEALRVKGGDRVAAGAPVGRSGPGLSTIGFELRRAGLPHPVTPFLIYG